MRDISLVAPLDRTGWELIHEDGKRTEWHTGREDIVFVGGSRRYHLGSKAKEYYYRGQPLFSLTTLCGISYWEGFLRYPVPPRLRILDTPPRHTTPCRLCASSQHIRRTR
jgi:hypothetical protein